jgi:hypothetical protein
VTEETFDDETLNELEAFFREAMWRADFWGLVQVGGSPKTCEGARKLLSVREPVSGALRTTVRRPSGLPCSPRTDVQGA